MQVRSTLTKTSAIALAITVILLGLLAFLNRQPKSLSKVKATTESSSNVVTADPKVDSVKSAPVDVTVNGQHIDMPENGSKTIHLNSGEKVEVSSTQEGGSSTVTTSPNGSIQVSTQTSNNNSSASSTTQVFSSSFNQSSNSSQDHVFSTSNNSVQVTH